MIFWRRLPTGHIVGAELDRARWIADLIAELPQTPQAETPASQSRIQLVDSHGDAVYQWGAFEPPRGAAPLAELPASAPLSAWRFKFFVAEDRFTALAGRSADFNLIAGLSAIGVVLLALAGFFYRESSRELREAATRVNFVNQVSHELKTPLTNIRLYAELLAEQLQDGETVDAASAQRRLSIIVSESGRLSRLIGNVLTFAQQQRRQIELNPQPGRIDDTIQAVIQQFQPTLQAQGVVTTFAAGAGAVVNFDADAVEQILVNLFNNVEKYAAPRKATRHRQPPGRRAHDDPRFRRGAGHSARRAGPHLPAVLPHQQSSGGTGGGGHRSVDRPRFGAPAQGRSAARGLRRRRDVRGRFAHAAVRNSPQRASRRANHESSRRRRQSVDAGRTDGGAANGRLSRSPSGQRGRGPGIVRDARRPILSAWTS